MKSSKGLGLFLFCVTLLLSGSAFADTEAELAKKLQNPVANLVSVPLQNNWDFGVGPKDATNYLLNVQPVIPVSITDDWNVIVRTIMPLHSNEAPVDGAHTETGLGDIQQSFFFSPKDPINGWIVGAGPAMVYPSATETTLGSDKWSMGPTFVVLRQEHGWTYGILANQVWSFANSSGGDDKPYVSSAFLQPFLSYTTTTHTTFTINTESTYNWEARQWTAPLNLMAAQLVKIGELPVQFQLGAREYMDAPDGGPNWGLRFAVTFLFPS